MRVPYKVRLAHQFVADTAAALRRRLESVSAEAGRVRRRLSAQAKRAADWPYTSATLDWHNHAAERHLRGAESALHGREPSRFSCGTVRTAVESSVPPLAWLARLTPTGWAVTVGPGVEASEHGIFEGVWAGDFTAFRPDQSDYAFGSGAVWPQGDIVFVPPRHLEECLFVLHRASDATTLVSNSLAFLLQEAGVKTGDALFSAIAEKLVDHAFEQGKRGVDRVWPLVASDGDSTLYQCSYFNFTVDAGGRPRRRWHPATSEFSTYPEYVSLLAHTVSDLFGNGSDPARCRPLVPVAAVSSGYDSPACAAIARTAGCRRAVTLDASFYGHDDSGRRVAEALGMELSERTHVLGPVIDKLDMDSGDHLFDQAAEFIATFGIGDDVTFLPFEEDLRDAVLVTGTWGDSIWARFADVPSGLPVRILFGKSLTEFRLRTGFAHVPLPFVGARFAEPIRRLSRSEEMHPWCVGGDYDRPIPRRIAEEAGVPRDAFGVAKVATAPWLKNHQELFPRAMERVMARYARS